MGAYTEILDFTFTANETSRTFSGLSITKDDFIKVVITQINNSGTAAYLSLLPNSSVTTNFHNQELYGIGSATGAGRANSTTICGANQGKNGQAFVYLKLSENDRANFFSNYSRDLGTTHDLLFSYSTSSGATFTSGITSLNFSSNNANGLGTGSRIQIYKLAAEKVADITVATNTTQVDISSLSIDKDSEYLLVSDVVKGATGSQTTELFVNDNTTSTNYHSQRIFGNGSSATATRFNSAFYMSVLDSNRHLGYTHIKLSNIGAYTAQSYTISDAGSSSIGLRNFFISSTSEAITSITKLNIKQTVTNGIGTGSRFILYKLYE